MRRIRSALVLLVLGSLALMGCNGRPAQGPSGTPPVATPGANPVTSTSGKACTVNNSAVDLPSGPYGSGTTLTANPPGAAPEHPRLGYMSADQSGNGTIYMYKGGTATVDAGAFWLRGLLMPAPDDAWHETHLQLEGIQPEQSQYWGAGDSASFDYLIPAGEPGDTFRLTLTDVVLADGTAGDVTVTFCRQAPPTVSLADGEAGRLLLTFTHEMFKETVVQALTGPHDKEGRSQGDWIADLRWVDDRTLELTPSQSLPHVLTFNLMGAQAQNGLFVVGGLAHRFTGAPPRVVAIAPVTSTEKVLADLPTEPSYAELSSDGQSLRVMTQQFKAGYFGPDWQSLDVDLATGKARPLPSDERFRMNPHIEWMDEGSLKIIRPGKADAVLTDLPPFDGFYLSPNGEWVALLVVTGPTGPDSRVPVRFAMYSVDGAQVKELEGSARMWRPGKDGIHLYDPVWSPDSTRIAFTQDDGGDHTWLVVAEMAEGALRTLTPTIPGGIGRFDPVSWSPDGSMILVGPTMIDARSGQVVGRIDGAVAMPFWRQDGEWLLLQATEWSEVTAYHRPTGEAHSLGAGLLLGWRPDGTALLIRWDDAQYRTRWGY